MYTENALSRVIAGSIKRNEHLENILLVFFESLPLPERTCSLLTKDERATLSNALDMARERRKS